MPHRTTTDGRVRIADMNEGVYGTCHDPDLSITPQQARELAVELVERADAAEGHTGPHGFVTRVEVLMRLRNLEEQIARLLADA